MRWGQLTRMDQKDIPFQIPSYSAVNLGKGSLQSSNCLGAGCALVCSQEVVSEYLSMAFFFPPSLTKLFCLGLLLFSGVFCFFFFAFALPILHLLRPHRNDTLLYR